MYKAKGGESCPVDGNNIEVTLCEIANLPVVKEALMKKKNQKTKSKKEVEQAIHNANEAAKAAANHNPQEYKKNPDYEGIKDTALQTRLVKEFVKKYKQQYENEYNSKKEEDEKQKFIKKLNNFTKNYCTTIQEDWINIGINPCFKKLIDMLKINTTGGDHWSIYVENLDRLVIPIEDLGVPPSKVASKFFYSKTNKSNEKRLLTFDEKTKVYNLIIHKFVDMVKDLLEQWKTNTNEARTQ